MYDSPMSDVICGWAVVPGPIIEIRVRPAIISDGRPDLVRVVEETRPGIVCAEGQPFRISFLVARHCAVVISQPERRRLYRDITELRERTIALRLVLRAEDGGRDLIDRNRCAGQL